MIKLSRTFYAFILICISVDGGHRAVIFDRFQGVKPDVIGEGTHFLIPWVQRPVIFDIRSRPRNVPTVTGSKGMASCVLLKFLENNNVLLLFDVHIA